MGLLKSKVPKEYRYHNYHHTEYIIEKVFEIGKEEGCNEDELRLLSLAALWHDVGYINTYTGHEEEGCKMVRKYFPAFGVEGPDIEKVCGMIMATRVPQQPHNKLEEIIADADLEYLGTSNAEKLAQNLYDELKFRYPDLSFDEWIRTQVSFIGNHHYFTTYCIQYREPLKQRYLAELMEKAA